MRPSAALMILAGLALAAAAPPQLPHLTATSVAGERISLDASSHDVVIVHFWASWCAPCRVEMPMLDAAWRKYGGKGVKIVGIALDAGASRHKIAHAGMGVGFPLVRLDDSNIRPRTVPGALPETRVYGRDGRLRYRFHAGGTMLNAETLDRIIPPLLAEP